MLVFTLVSTTCHAFTPNIQAALFNAALNHTSLIQQQRLIRYTDILYKSLNGNEVTSLLGHQQLKIASYMYLVEFWQSYSLEKVLYERGVNISNDTLTKLGIKPETFSVQLSNVGPLNIAFNANSKKQCIKSKNQPFNVTYIDTYNAIVRLQNYLLDKPEPSAQAALFYLKSYYYLRLHSPNSTYSYVNDECISDVNGLLTCATSLASAIKPSNLAVVRRYMDIDLKRFELDYAELESLADCNLTMWHYIQSAGGLEPVSDGATVAASQALISLSDKRLKKKAQKHSDFKSIMRDAKEIMDFLYFPQKYLTSSDDSVEELSQSLMLNQIKLASLRLQVLISNEFAMNVEPSKG